MGRGEVGYRDFESFSWVSIVFCFERSAEDAFESGSMAVSRVVAVVANSESTLGSSQMAVEEFVFVTQDLE